MIGSQLLRFKKDQIYLAKDWETESLNLFHARPWQLSYIVFNLKEILEKKTYYIWFKDLKVSIDAARITRFNYDEYKKFALPACDIQSEIDKYIYNPEIITMSHSLFHFDCMIHNNLRRNVGLEEDFSYLDRAIDTLALSRAYNSGSKPVLDNFTEWQYQMISQKAKKGTGTLSTMAKTFKLEVDESRLHDATYDTERMVEVFKQLLWNVEL